MDNGLGRSCAVAAALFVIPLGCGSRAPQPQSAVQGREETTGALREPVRLEPIHIKAARDRDRLIIHSYDASGLFAEAPAAFRPGDLAEAVELYTKLVAEFPDSSLAPPALYNSGLGRERLGDFEGASRDYLGLAAGYASSPDVTDALFRAGGAFEKMEAWDDAIRIFGRILTERQGLKATEKIEALARTGSSLMAAGRPLDARPVLEEAVTLYRMGRGITPSSSTFYYAMAQFKLAEILHGEMRDAALPADEAALEPALELKCRLLLDAQAEYAEAIEILHPHWAAAAAYRIGGLYRNLWDDLVAAPTPEDLTDEERQIYLDILRKRIRVLLTKAVAQWERTLRMIRRLELEGEWAKRTEEDLAEIRELLAIEESAVAEEELQ